MAFYRSQTVDRYTMYLPRESAWNIMNRLGQKDLIHVVANPNIEMNGPYAQQVKRCEEALHKIITLEEVLVSKKVESVKHSYDKIYLEQLFSHWESAKQAQSYNESAKINEVINQIEELWTSYTHLQKRIQALDQTVSLCRENIAILMAGERQYGKNFFKKDSDNVNKNRSEIKGLSFESATSLNYQAGVIRSFEEIRFKKAVFRITKGNCMVETVKFSQIYEQIIDGEQEKMVFFVLYPARENSYFNKKLIKLISNYSEHKHEVLNSKFASSQMKVRQLERAYEDAYSLRQMCKDQMDTYLEKGLMEKVEKRTFLGIKRYEYLKLYLYKEKELYSSLNQLQVHNHFLSGAIFIKRNDITEAQRMLTLSSQSDTHKLPGGYIMPSPSTQKHPSIFSLNSYTRPAQEIVETYGVPRYKEVNPSYFTTVTFPFLFGVMFGDIAHGMIILTVGLFLLWANDKNEYNSSDLFKAVTPYRYLISMMGFFAVYCGFIYNDFMSIALNLFGSCYDVSSAVPGSEIAKQSSCVYPFGIDPVWAVADNTLNFTNSLKMKISVIIGVLHMTLGVCLKASNQVYFRNIKELIFQFVPQIIFLTALFGYMDFLIIYKWLVEWNVETETALAPSIISQMIAIPLAAGSTEGKPLWNMQSQENLQFALLVISGIAVPLMLFPVPLMKIFSLRRKQNVKRKKKQFDRLSQSDSVLQNQIDSSLLQQLDRLSSQDLEKQQQENLEALLHEQQSPSEIFVHQIIETIEYVLGSVSNTASYLRLWALSLAHSQLSEVFFEKTVEHSITSGWSGLIMNIVGFAMLAGITVGIMLCMDSMQCFLHTLRLHWVEFQNKFYKGDGISFKIFSFSEKINQELRLQNQ